MSDSGEDWRNDFSSIDLKSLKSSNALQQKNTGFEHPRFLEMLASFLRKLSDGEITAGFNHLKYFKVSVCECVISVGILCYVFDYTDVL